MSFRHLAASLLISVPVATAFADDAPAPPPPEHTWIGKGQFGFLDSKGNSDAESINGNIDLSRYDGNWKNDFYAGGLYGKSSGIVSAERYEVRTQTNYSITTNLFAFGGLRYEHDEFDGFQYQASVTAGLGYKFLDTDSDKLTAQIGAGFKRLRPETIMKDVDGNVISRVPLDQENDAIGTVGVDYVHNFNKATSISNKLLVESGASNTLATDTIALTVKMSSKLALSIGYGITDNTDPPAPLKKVDTVTTVNLVFNF